MTEHRWYDTKHYIIDKKELEHLETINAELVEALTEIAFSSYHYTDALAEFERRRKVAGIALEKARTQ